MAGIVSATVCADGALPELDPDPELEPELDPEPLPALDPVWPPALPGSGAFAKRTFTERHRLPAVGPEDAFDQITELPLKLLLVASSNS